MGGEGPSYARFVAVNGSRLRAGLVSAFGLPVGIEAGNEALARGWDQWDRLREHPNPLGCLYREGERAAAELRARSTGPGLDRPSAYELPRFEPGLVPALERLTPNQRVCVLLVHAHGWTIEDAAQLLDLARAQARSELDQGMIRLAAMIDGLRDAR